MEDEEKFLMVNVASKTLEYKDRHPKEIPEKIIKRVFESLESENVKDKINQNMEILGIAAANEAIKLRTGNPKATFRQIMQMFMVRIEEIAKESMGK